MSLVRAQHGEPKEYSLSAVGVDDAEDPPVPIPNTEDKLSGAENSALATRCENREMPTLDSEYFFIQKRTAIEVSAQWGPCINTNRYNTFYS